MIEEWRDIPGYEGLYQASNFGRARSLERWTPHKRYGLQWVRGRVLKISPSGKYESLALYKDGIRESKMRHQMVLETFVGPRPEGMVACHNDSNTRNSVLSNLRWDTRSGNELDKITNGTYQVGVRNPRARLVEQDILDIQEKRATGLYTLKELGEAYGVGITQISRIIKGEQWTHIST